MTTQATIPHPKSANRIALRELARAGKKVGAEYGKAVGLAIAETLWPTRCAICDAPGEFLCSACERNLEYIDTWQACPICGSPYGRIQCSECNGLHLGDLGLERAPFEQAISPVALDDAARTIVTTFKDKGEQHLAEDMARLMAAYTPPSWKRSIVTFIPATTKAFRRRGFDHAELIAKHYASRIETPCVGLFDRPRTIDQRKLSRGKRLENMRAGLVLLPGASVPKRIIVVDDVMTTGATMFAACEVLQASGAKTVRAATFARTW